MMINSTEALYFTLTAYFDTGMLKYLYFIITMTLYMSIVSVNVFLIVVICLNRSLHEPMYIFMCSLFVNELYGSTALFPFFLLQILSDVHTISASFCFLQMFCVNTYAGVQFTNLVVMSYDRYLAICYPLQYNTRMTSKKIAMLIALIWLYSPLTCMTYTVYLKSLSQLCGNTIQKVYCDGHSLVNMTCSDTFILSVYGFILSFGSNFGALFFIIFTYRKILVVCFSGSKETRQKAVSTCTPHLASLLNFIVGCSFEVLQSKFNMNNVPNMLRIFLSLHFLTCPPLFNPVMYGLNISKIRVITKRLMSFSSQ